jgi:hypothetical protein
VRKPAVKKAVASACNASSPLPLLPCAEPARRGESRYHAMLLQRCSRRRRMIAKPRGRGNAGVGGGGGLGRHRRRAVTGVEDRAGAGENPLRGEAEDLLGFCAAEAGGDQAGDEVGLDLADAAVL